MDTAHCFPQNRTSKKFNTTKQNNGSYNYGRYKIKKGKVMYTITKKDYMD